MSKLQQNTFPHRNALRPTMQRLFMVPSETSDCVVEAQVPYKHHLHFNKTKTRHTSQIHNIYCIYFTVLHGLSESPTVMREMKKYIIFVL